MSVIDTATDTVIGSPIPVGNFPIGIAVIPDGTKVYVGNKFSNSVSVIDTATDTVIGSPIPLGNVPIGIAATPDGRNVYVANSGDNSVSAIDASKNLVTVTIPVGEAPFAFGIFIQPAQRFVRTPGFSNCHGKSVAALAVDKRAHDPGAGVSGRKGAAVLGAPPPSDVQLYRRKLWPGISLHDQREGRQVVEPAVELLQGPLLADRRRALLLDVFADRVEPGQEEVAALPRVDVVGHAALFRRRIFATRRPTDWPSDSDASASQASAARSSSSLACSRDRSPMSMNA